MSSPNNHINYRTLEWNKLESLNVDLYEAIMDDESEDILSVITKLQYRLAGIKKDHKKEKE